MKFKFLHDTIHQAVKEMAKDTTPEIKLEALKLALSLCKTVLAERPVLLGIAETAIGIIAKKHGLNLAS